MADPLFSMFRIENAIRCLSAADKCLQQVSPDNIPLVVADALRNRMSKLGSIAQEVGSNLSLAITLIVIGFFLQVENLIRSHHGDSDDGFSEEGISALSLLEELTRNSRDSLAWDGVFSEED